jgi:hypothetical protein
MNSMIGTYLTMGLTMMEDMKTQSEQRKKEILAEWNKSKNYPRKKKKRVRKELQLDWAIANWDPFDGMVNF